MKKLCFLIAAMAMAQNMPAPPGMQCPQRTLVRFDIAAPDSDKAAQLRDEHFKYMLELMKAGKVIAAGPIEDHQHAIMIFATGSWPDVEAALRGEPFTREGILKIAGHDIWFACQASETAK